MKIFLQILLGLLSLVMVVVVGLAIWIGPMTYRAIHGVHVYETTPPQLPAGLKSPAFLVFSKTNGFRDSKSIDAADAMFRDIAKQRGWGVYVTENAAVFNSRQLSRFKAVVWNSTSGDVLTMDQRKAFQDYLNAGGGFVGVHGAGGDLKYLWRWYVDDLIGAQFTGHTMWPHISPATIHIVDPAHPAMAGLPATWVRSDEWYSFAKSVREKGYRVLATVDETTYQPHGMTLKSIAMGRDHPLIWTHCVGRGRAFYSALGHAAATYAEPLHRRMFENAITWASADTPCKDGL
jgi:type 1 glutamine amidotransferase